jgi:hypothetical protein
MHISCNFILHLYEADLGCCDEDDSRCEELSWGFCEYLPRISSRTVLRSCMYDWCGYLRRAEMNACESAGYDNLPGRGRPSFPQ